MDEDSTAAITSLNEDNIENSVEFVLSCLNSNNTDLIIETIIQIKNLIIGNNKYKSFYLKENLINCLIDLVNKHFGISGVINKQQIAFEPNDLVNQILIIFASFSLGNLEHIICLIKYHNLHELLFNLIKLTPIDCTQPHKLSLKIIESSVRCLANLYSSSQLVPSLIYTMDKQLYDSTNLSDNTRSYLDLLLRYYPLSNMTKQSVITIVSISSQIISIALTSSNRYVRNLQSLSTCSTSTSSTNLINITQTNISSQKTITNKTSRRPTIRLIKLDEQLRRHRSVLLKSDCISKFSHLLTSLLEPIQLQTLKFYSSICFENVDAARLILATSYYECSLIDLLSTYLSRENSAELQLHAAKCLTNLCRSLLRLTTSKPIKHASTPKQQQSTSPIPQPTMIARSKVTTLKKLNKIKLEETGALNTPDEIQNDLNDRQLPKQVDSCFYKLIDYSSQLIRLRILPTLVRLCCTYSAQYRNQNSITSLPINNYFDLIKTPQLNSNKIQLNQQSYLNLFLLIQSVSTLTYLIELNSDLQSTAGCLEQIIPSLAFNIIDAYSLFDLGKIKLIQTNRLKSLKRANLMSNKLNEINIKKRRLFTSVERINKKVNMSSTKSFLKYVSSFSSLSSSSSSSSASSSSTSTPSSTTTNYPDQSTCLIEYSSLFSAFYLNYNQFSSKGTQFKLNEHQYRQLSQVNFNPYDLIKCDDLRYVKLVNRINRYLSILNQTVHKRLASVCFHALAALAANNEEARRQISENTCLISRLIDSVNLNLNEQQHKQQMDQHEINNQAEEYINIMDETNYDEDDLDEIDLIDDLEDDFDDLNQTDSDLLRLSGLCLLHSLSRSVHQLRTKFLDKKIWFPILDLIKRVRQRRIDTRVILQKNQHRIAMKSVTIDIDNNDLKTDYKNRTCPINEDDAQPIVTDDIELSDFDSQQHHHQQQLDVFLCDGSLNEQNLISITTAILANLLLDFSPSKETMIENGIIDILVELMEHKNHSVRVNCMWSLMNLGFQSDQKTKQLILSTITVDKVFQLLTEQDETLVLKTLGLIRNLISSRIHIDSIMSTCGTKIIQAIVMILESEYYNVNIKEQALCILSNVADGQTSKEFIMNNEDLLRKINSFMTHNLAELQIAAVFCISNLVWSSDEGSLERQTKLKDMGAQKILQKLLTSVDPILYDKVKITLHQFSSNSQSLSSSSSSSTSSLINSISTT